MSLRPVIVNIRSRSWFVTNSFVQDGWKMGWNAALLRSTSFPAKQESRY